MKLKLIIAVVLVIASMFVLMSCNDDADAVIDMGQENADEVLNKYDVEGAELSTEKSREALEKKYKALQTMFNLAVDTVANTEGEVKEAVKALGTEIVNLLNTKIAKPEYSKYEAFIKDATKQIDEFTNRLTSLVPSIAD